MMAPNGFGLSPKLIILAVIFLAGCASTARTPLNIDRDFADKDVKSISLLPVVDLRVERSADIDFGDSLRDRARKEIEAKGYIVNLADLEIDSTAITSPIDTKDLSLMGLEGDDAVMVIYIEDVLDKYTVMSYAFKIEGTAALVSRKEQIELWRDKSITSQGGGGLISGIFKGGDKWVAIGAFVDNIFLTLPKKE